MTEIVESVVRNNSTILCTLSIVKYAIGDFPNASRKMRRNCDEER